MRRIIPMILTGAALGLFSVVFSAGGLAIAQDGSEVDPLLEVAADMNSAAVKLAKLHTDTPTQTAQQSALKKLDEIIARLEEKEKNRQGNGARGNRAAEASTIKNGPGGMGTLHAEHREGKQWGELPAKERERILQSMNDGFPSHYQKILERYFARLADEKPLPEGDAAAAAGTPDSKATPAPAPAGTAAPAATTEKDSP